MEVYKSFYTITLPLLESHFIAFCMHMMLMCLPKTIVLLLFLFSLEINHALLNSLGARRLFLPSTSVTHGRAKRKQTSNLLFMRDRSAAYWFSVGDKVKVIDDVYKMNNNLNGRIGVVTETWEKCEVSVEFKTLIRQKQK